MFENVCKNIQSTFEMNQSRLQRLKVKKIKVNRKCNIKQKKSTKYYNFILLHCSW